MFARHTISSQFSYGKAGALPICLFTLLFLFSIVPINVSAKEEGDGLERTLKSGKKVINFSGKEGEDVKIPKNVTVIGKSTAQAVINGDVRMENGAVLKNVTINAQVIGVTVEKGASVVLENVIVKGALDTGIFAKEGGGTVTVRNSKILQNRKGFYILPGRTLILTNNEITKNKEEGIDVRNGVGGSITGNRVSENGEGGAEIIVGSSVLTVSSNTFVSNKASGLSLQFYADAKSLGKMSVNSNTFSGNGNFGIYCGSPGGGTLPVNFFRNSVKLSQNVMSGNKKGAIHPYCNLTNTFPIPIKAEAEKKEQEVENDEMQIDTSVEKEKEVERIQEATEALREDVAVATSFFRKWGYYFFSYDKAMFLSLEVRAAQLQQELFLLSVSRATDKNIELNESVSGKIFSLQNELKNLSQQLAIK